MSFMDFTFNNIYYLSKTLDAHSPTPHNTNPHVSKFHTEINKFKTQFSVIKKKNPDTIFEHNSCCFPASKGFAKNPN